MAIITTLLSVSIAMALLKRNSAVRSQAAPAVKENNIATMYIGKTERVNIANY